MGAQLFMHGGSYYKADGSGLASLDDTWLLDAASNRWHQLSSSDSTRPSPRNAAVMEAVGQQCVLHGGWLPFRETYTDTWTLRADKP